MNAYMVVAYGIKDGKPYSNLRGIREGKKKATGEPYGFTEENSFKQIDESLALGTIVRYEERRIEDTAAVQKTQVPPAAPASAPGK